MTSNASQRTIVTLAADVPDFVAAALRRLPEVDVVDRAPATSTIQTEGVQLLKLDVIDIAELRAQLDASTPPVGRPPRLAAITGALDAETASRLEDLGIAFADVEGRAWIPGQRRTQQSRLRRPEEHRHLRPESLRLAQLLADHPGQRWTERSLAARGDSTQPTAHRLLRRMEDAGLVERDGAGRNTSRYVSDQPGLRTWLLHHGRPGRVVRLRFYVRDPWHVPSQVENVHLALTGAGAAERMNTPLLTRPPVPAYRADCGRERLEDVPGLLNGFRTDAGANAVLIADPGRLAHVDGRSLDDGTLIAPPSRIMLDLLLEGRGGALARLFADLWQDRVL